MQARYSSTRKLRNIAKDVQKQRLKCGVEYFSELLGRSKSWCCNFLNGAVEVEGNSPRSFKCIIHDDKHPSASIFKVDSGVELYCCNATSCKFKGNIIQVVAELEECSRSEAITKICINLNIEYKVDSKLEALLRDNINTIKDDIKNSHTDLHSTVYRYLPTLRELHEIAIDNLEYAKAENKFLFTASIQYIAQQLGRRDKKNTTADIGFYVC